MPQKPSDLYEGYDPEARAYFEALDYAFERHGSLEPKPELPQARIVRRSRLSRALSWLLR